MKCNNIYDIIITFWGTVTHKLWVLYFANKFCCKILWRALKHDLSKFTSVESRTFAHEIRRLKHLKYGSMKYNDMLRRIKPALEHHYKVNSHHSEYHNNGFRDMSGLDRIELVIDWIAATKRTKAGNIYNSLEINKKRFGYSESDMEWIRKIVNDIV